MFFSLKAFKADRKQTQTRPSHRYHKLDSVAAGPKMSNLKALFEIILEDLIEKILSEALPSLENIIWSYRGKVFQNHTHKIIIFEQNWPNSLQHVYVS